MKKTYTEVYLHFSETDVHFVGRFKTAEDAHYFMRNYIKQNTSLWIGGAWHEYREVTVEE